MKDFCLHKSTIKPFLSLVDELLLSGKRYRVDAKQWVDKRTLPMNSTWRMWMEDTANYLTKNGWSTDVKNSKGVVVGVLPFSSDECHAFFVEHYCGLGENGKRLSTAKMEKGEMLAMMEKHQAWCMGHKVPLRIPADCEYNQLQNEG